MSPRRTAAFWFFSTPANADSGPVTPDSATPVLKAAVNSDPNPNKGIADVIAMSDNALLSHGGPLGSTADVASSTLSSDRISVYVTRSGDTLSEIANMFDVSVNTIIWANDLKNTRDIHPGQRLIILPVSGVERVILKGDTLASIAKKYHADAGEIAQYNGLNEDTPLTVGSTIIIPGGEIATPKSAPGASVAPREPFLGGSGAAYSGYYVSPIPGGILTQSIHGWNAVDLGAARGTPIHAAAAGTVIIAKNNGAWNGGYGNYVVINHANGSQTLYSHMSRAIVSSGTMVNAGEIIGYVGMTGLTTGPHVHFEVRGAANPFRNCRVGSVCSPQ